MTKDPLNNLGPLNAGNDIYRPTTVLTHLDINLEHPLEAPGPGHRAALFGFGGSGVAGRTFAASIGRDEGTPATVWSEDPMVASEVDPRPGDQRGQPGDKVQ